MKNRQKIWLRLVRYAAIWLTIVTFVFLLIFYHPWVSQQRLIGATYMTMNNNFYVVLNEQIANAVNRKGDRLLTRDPALKVSKQVDQIDDFIKQGVSVIIIAPVNGNSVKIHQALQRARREGIKIINVDTELKWKNDADCIITSNNYRAGELEAKYMMAHQKKAKILLLEQATAFSAIQRIDGFTNEVAASDHKQNYQIVGRLETYGQSEIALPKVANFIDHGKKFDTVMALNDQAAVGALSAIAAKKIKRRIAVYSVDGAPNMKGLIGKNANAVATSSQSPVAIGSLTGKTVYRMLNNQPIAKWLVTPVKVIDRANIGNYSTTGWQ
ncbi:substrate-binding domain-containing protein [Lactobacillus porci]|uniref:substrate-binding domain-containing protein n=1 Tax=Lactobacillus porci TaxID=2012477 RepID=UPI003992C484